MDLIQIFAMAVFIKSFGNNGIKTDRERVRLCLKTIDPESVKRRKAYELKRQMYVFQGPNFKWNIYSYDKLKPFGFPIHEAVDRFSRKIFRVLARPYLMTLHVIFSIHVNFPITSRSILKTTVHENRNSEFFLRYLRKLFFKKTLLWYCACTLYLINFSVLSQFVSIFQVSLSIIFQLFFTISRDIL